MLRAQTPPARMLRAMIMDCSQVLVCVALFTVAIVSGRLLHRVRYEETPLMVLSAGVIADGALAYLSL